MIYRLTKIDLKKICFQYKGGVNSYSLFIYYFQMTREFSTKLQETVDKLMGNDGNNDLMAKQMMCISDDLCFIWSFKENCVLVLRLNNDNIVGGTESKCIKLVPTDTPLFDVEKINVSGTGRWICVSGSRG